MRFTITIEGDVEELSPASPLEAETRLELRSAPTSPLKPVNSKGTDPQHVISQLQALIDGLKQEPGRPQRAGTQETDSGHGDIPWTFEELRSAWRNFRPGARRILGIISEQPSGCSMDHIQDVLEQEDGKRTFGQGIGGRLSSISSAYKEFPRRQRIYNYDPTTAEYRMDLDVAEIVHELSAADLQEPPKQL